MSGVSSTSGQIELFPEATSKLKKRKKKSFSWDVEIFGEVFSVEGATKREAFAEVTRAALGMIGCGDEYCYRVALKNGAKVLFKNTL